MAWEMKARAAVADRAEKRRVLGNKFSQKNKGKHNSMADFLREFENNVSLQVEQLRGMQINTSKEIKQDTKRTFDERFKAFDKTLKAEIDTTTKGLNGDMHDLKSNVIERLQFVE